MSFFDNPSSILLLRDLLNPQDNSSDSEDEARQMTRHDLGPSSFGSKKNNEKQAEIEKENNEEKPKPKPPLGEENDPVEEWLKEQEKTDNILLETRKKPHYDIIFKQAVSAEDMFLQMGNKTATSASCEDMIISIQLPEETVGVENMDLSLNEDEIDLQTPIYRLKIPLIHQIDPDKGNAKFDPDTKLLKLTLRMKREFDYANF